MEKTMVPYQKLWSFDFYIIKHGTMEKTKILWKKYGTIL